MGGRFYGEHNKLSLGSSEEEANGGRSAGEVPTQYGSGAS